MLVGVLLLTAGALRAYGVPVRSTATFAAYLLVGVAAPGMLLWRAAGRRSASLVEDLALGAGVGLAVEVLAYIAARAAGAPLLTLAWPAVTLAVFACVPRLRRFWRSSADPADRVPTWWAAVVGAVLLALVAFSCARWFRNRGLTWPGYAFPEQDTPFHLSLVGEVRHHVPPSIPYVRGEPLLYHWFSAADMAATSWATGIEPMVLMYRLTPVALIFVAVVGVAAAARRLVEAWWAGPVAVVITYLVLAPQPYGWSLPPANVGTGFGVVDDGSLLRPTLWMSPSQSLGAALAVPLVLVAIDLLRSPRAGLGRWALLVVLLVATSGAKATYLPMLFAGLLLVLAVGVLVRRRVHRRAVLVAAVTLVVLAGSQLVLFRGAEHGMAWEPFATYDRIGLVTATRLLAGDAPPSTYVAITAVFLLCWAAIFAGVFGLGRGRRYLEPPHLLLVGIGVAGMVPVLLLGQPGLSQSFFLQGARPFLAVAAVCGLAHAIPVARRSSATALVLLLTAAVGAGLVLLLQRLGDSAPPVLTDAGRRADTLGTLLRPYAVLVAIVLVSLLLLLVLRRKVPLLAGMAFPVLAVLVMGMGLTGGEQFLRGQMAWLPQAFGQPYPYTSKPVLARGTMEAGRWLRANSAPDDLVATNNHCRGAARPPARCDNRQFSVSAYSERRVLIEGWGYTPPVFDQARGGSATVGAVPFWDPRLMAANDAAFTRPSARTVHLLRDSYGVRWLFVDRRLPVAEPGLRRLAVLRFQSADCAVYELSR